jgi:predicted transcriptional regulator
LDDENAEYISEIFRALSSKERILTLETLSVGKTRLMDLARKACMSRSGFQNIVDDFRNARLIEHTEHRSYYKLSQKGKEVLKLLREFHHTLEPIEKKYREEQLKQSISKFGSGLSKEEILDIIEKAGSINEKESM